jgi:predicted Zn-dependent protease
MTGQRAQDDVERALRAAGRGDRIVIAEETSSANLRWADNTLTTNGVQRSRRLTVIAVCAGRRGPAAGVVSRAGVRPDQIPDLVAEAEQTAAETEAAPDAQPLISPDTRWPAGSGAATAGAPTAGLDWDAPASGTEAGVLGAFAGTLGETFGAAAAAKRRLYGFAEHAVTSEFLGSSTGLRLRHDQPAGRAELNAKSADLAQSAWVGAATRDFTDVRVAGMYAGLATQLDWAGRQVEFPAGRYETLLSPAAVADLCIYLYWSAGAKDAIDGRTVFSRPGGGTRVGDRLAHLPLTLRSDPGTPGLQCEPFVVAHASGRDSSVFDNGLALAPTNWISGGALAALIQTRQSAALSGLPVTPAIDNLILDVPGASASLAEMIADTGRGLLVSCLWYIREVDPQTLLLTGLTRDGVYLVENGEVTGAVNNFRFNESPVAMLNRVTEAGPTGATLPREWSDYFTRTAMPPLRVDGFNMSSVSPAS